MENKEMLDFEFDITDSHRTITIKDFLKEILGKVFSERNESVVGKILFSDSKWTSDIYLALARADFIENNCSDGYWDYSEEEARKKMREIINEL